MLVAVDVSKEKLDVLYDDTGDYEIISNDRRGINRLIKRLKKTKSRLVFEASGGYDRLLKEKALGYGIDCSICNGRRVREFARSQGRLAKTDKIDTHVIADYAKTIELPVISSIDRQLEDLKALSVRRRQLLDLINQEENKLEFEYPKLVEKSIKSSLGHLRKQLETLDKEIGNLVNDSEELKSKKRLLETIPGFGTVVSVTLLTALPELGSLSKAAIASLAGVAPLNRDSGKYQGQRRTGHSRPQIKSVLYMATLSAIRSNPKIKKFYQHLKNKGKKSKVAIVACMRKLIIYANAMLKKQEGFKA